MRIGLCAGCRHRREIRNRRGSVFLLCSLSQVDSRFRRYPPLPVLRCEGFEAGDPDPEPEADADAGPDAGPGAGSPPGSGADPEADSDLEAP